MQGMITGLLIMGAVALGASPGSAPRPESSERAAVGAPERSVILFRVRTKHEEGPIRCGLYDAKKDWLSSRYAFKSTGHVEGRVAVCRFDGVPPGRYAISAYHDADDDSELDRNFVGIPSEDFTFSSGARAGLGPPSFEDADFVFRGGTLRLRARM
jgi:uncharacterized protein (DUF2141 family)